MSRRQKILVVVIGILIILGLAYWLFIRPAIGPTGTPKTNVNSSNQPVSLPPTTTTVTAVVPEATPEETLRSDLLRLAAAFAERFGSYSNQGNYENLLDLKTLMTTNMQAWTDNFIKQSQAASGTNSVYYGVTTKAISTSIASLDEVAGTATIVVGTQRRESSGSMADSSVINYQNLQLVFKKVNGEWKVDEATWQ